MKKFYIVDIKGNKIIYVSTEKKAKLFAEVRGGKLKEASPEERDLILENNLRHLSSFKTDEMEVNELQKLHDDEEVEAPVVEVPVVEVPVVEVPVEEAPVVEVPVEEAPVVEVPVVEVPKVEKKTRKASTK